MNPTHEIRAADALAIRLFKAGCRYAFGMPGGEVLTLVDALEAAGITFILTKHENAAAFMAEGVYHQSGAPGILVATLGPGALNGVNAVANAHQDRVPMIVLTGAVDTDEAQTYTHQVLDQQAVFRPITKASFQLVQAAAHVIADKAVAIATEGRPGPVHIDVPISVADSMVPAAPPPARADAAKTAPAGADLDTARAWLACARRPILIVGLDAMTQNAGATLTAFSVKFKIPVITTYKAKGLLTEDHPLALGAAGLSPLADRQLLPLVEAADLVLCVGYDPIEMRTGWRDAWSPDLQRIIDITAEPNHHYMHQSSLNIIADCAASLAAISGGITPLDTWPCDRPNKTRASLAAAFPVTDTWGPAAVIDTCRKVLPRNTIATVDSGAHRILLSQMWSCYAQRGLIQSTALCTMGCAIPLAMGAKLAAPDVPIVSFSGDAGFLMVAGELATAAELDLRCVFVVFVDASLSLIELKQRSRQFQNTGVDFAHHDFAAIGRAFGGEGVTVKDRASLETALQHALGADRFTVIAAQIERGGYDGRI